jgi:hypothetical protein
MSIAKLEANIAILNQLSCQMGSTFKVASILAELEPTFKVDPNEKTQIIEGCYLLS